MEQLYPNTRIAAEKEIDNHGDEVFIVKTYATPTAKVPLVTQRLNRSETHDLMAQLVVLLAERPTVKE